MNNPPRILIVEDQYFVAIDCEQQLEEAGYACTGLATTRDEAYSMAERDHPDLVIMDIRLGGYSQATDDGVAAAIDIYEHLGIRCIFASAHADAATRQLALRARPVGWLDKPYTNDSLVLAVGRAIRELTAQQVSSSSRDPRTSRM